MGRIGRPLPGAGVGQQGVEAAGGRQDRGGQPGPAEASSRPRGSGGGGAAETWEAADGLSGSGGFFFFV